jgi:hypothetical protein
MVPVNVRLAELSLVVNLLRVVRPIPRAVILSFARNFDFVLVYSNKDLVAVRCTSSRYSRALM